ncbi:hypothetical protein E3N88_16085 [Mikania micrantha]|uniref:Arabidopsis retrotransposon Orf1 C-terminal domain-containing protein n=1 Tax=Mikania micrantha TaxID=192012 RepID=A0A5N6P0I0_9ASTR|nr:hypothetical protein E3N88_16085 [Mikania micrantha]
MADASSSGSRPKRTRRATTAQAQRQPQPPRQFSYSAPLDVPPPHARPLLPQLRSLPDHTFLQFARGTMEHARVTTLAGLEIIQHRGFDRAVIERLGRLEEFDSMLTPPWVYLLRCRWPQYAELTVEFHSTFQYNARSVTTPGAVSFALGRTAHSMSVADFVVAMGIYTREEVTARAFEDLLLGVSRAARPEHVTEDEMTAFWSTIAIPPHTDRRLATQIRDPLLRYIHRILTSTLIPRHSGKDKVSYFDLFCLYCLHGRRPANLATILLTSFARMCRGGHTARLDMGPYIYRLADRLGVLDWYPIEHLTLDPETVPYALHDMQTSGMVMWDVPPQWAPILADPPTPVPPMPPPSTHRILHRRERPHQDQEARQPAPPRHTVRYLHRRIDTIEDIVRSIAVTVGAPVPPRMPDPHLRSDHEPGSDIDPEDEEEDEEEDEDDDDDEDDESGLSGREYLHTVIPLPPLGVLLEQAFAAHVACTRREIWRNGELSDEVSKLMSQHGQMVDVLQEHDERITENRVANEETQAIVQAIEAMLNAWAEQFIVEPPPEDAPQFEDEDHDEGDFDEDPNKDPEEDDADGDSDNDISHVTIDTD